MKSTKADQPQDKKTAKLKKAIDQMAREVDAYYGDDRQIYPPDSLWKAIDRVIHNRPT